MPPVSCVDTLVHVTGHHVNKEPHLCAILTAMAMAMLASVTVSMGEETNGVFMVICLVSADVRSWVEDK